VKSIFKFRFCKEISRELIEKQLALAIVSAECIFGLPRVRINMEYYISLKNNSIDNKEEIEVVIDASNEIGEYVAQLFTGLVIRQFGEGKFIVNKENDMD